MPGSRVRAVPSAGNIAHDLEPGSSEILNNLGDAFRARGRIGEAAQ